MTRQGRGRQTEGVRGSGRKQSQIFRGLNDSWQKAASSEKNNGYFFLFVCAFFKCHTGRHSALSTTVLPALSRRDDQGGAREVELAL